MIRYNEQTATAYLHDSFARSLSNRHLHLILLPTEQCNFRCTYCYEDFEIGRMSESVVQGVRKLVERRIGELDSVDVSWFGGEPLLALDLVLETSEHIQSLCRENGCVKYSADMTTNGFRLDIGTARQLAGAGVRHFQISLDGPEVFHDQTRKRAGGQPTFARIWSNLAAIAASDLEVRITIRVHLTPQNLGAMPEFLNQVRRTFLDDPRFSVFLKPIVRLGGASDPELSVIPDRYVPEILRQLEITLYDAPVDPETFPPDVCYASMANSLLVRADGRLGKCTVILDDPRNAIGTLCADGSVRLDQERFRPWLEPWNTYDLRALSCPLTVLQPSAS